MFRNSFENFINPSAKEIRDQIARGEKIIVPYQISKEAVVNEDFTVIDSLMNTATQVGRGMAETILLGCKGYDDIPDELYDIPEVRKYIQLLFEKYPHLPYYLFKNDNAESWLFACCGESEQIGEQNTLSANELMEKYGSYDNIPKQPFSIKLEKEFLLPVLKATIAHGRKNKDTRRAKFIACHYAIGYSFTDILVDLKITIEELREFGFIK